MGEDESGEAYSADRNRIPSSYEHAVKKHAERSRQTRLQLAEIAAEKARRVAAEKAQPAKKVFECMYCSELVKCSNDQHIRSSMTNLDVGDGFIKSCGPGLRRVYTIGGGGLTL